VLREETGGIVFDSIQEYGFQQVAGGVVFDAVQEERVAIKVAWPREIQPPLRVESRLLRKLASDHVARIRDFGWMEVEGVPYLVLEELSGRDLSQVLAADGRLALRDAVDYVIQAGDALAEAHGLGVLHANVHPANLFLTQRRDGDPLVKVLDFGKHQTIGRPIDQRSDIYQLGTVLFELLTGDTPHQAKTRPGLLSEILARTPVPLRAYRDDLPGKLAAVLEKAYARHAQDRYPSVRDLVIALAPLAPARSRDTIEQVLRRPQPPVNTLT
jgi:serine/threonine-protein kinase